MTTAVFSRKVADYAASRPDYPDALGGALAELGLVHAGAVIADVGAGTGLLTRSLLARGCAVTAIEPNDEMRAYADAHLGAHARYRSIAGTAESTALDAASVDLVTAGQAFHWFAVEPTRREWLRILRPSGQVALVWNDRRSEDPIHRDLDALFGDIAGAARSDLLARQDRENVAAFFRSGPHRELSFPHEQTLDASGLEALAFSRSYMPPRTSDAGALAAARLRAVFDRHREGPHVRVRYVTVAIVGRPE